MSENNRTNGQDLNRDVARSVQTLGQKSDQRLKRVIETWQNPLAPRMSLILTICLGVLTAAMTAVDIKHYRLSGAETLLPLWENLSITLMGLWSLLAPLIILCALLDVYGNRKRLLKRKAASGIVDDTAEARARTRRAIRRQSRPSIARMLAVCIGWALIALMYLVMCILKI